MNTNIMTETLDPADRRLLRAPKGAIVLVIAAVLNVLQTLLYRILQCEGEVDSYFRNKYDYWDPDEIPFFDRVLRFLKEFFAFSNLWEIIAGSAFAACLLIFGVLLFVKRRKLYLTIALGIETLLLLGMPFLSLFRFLIEARDLIEKDGFFRLFWNKFLHEGYYWLPLVLSVALLAVIAASEIGKKGKNVLSHAKGGLTVAVFALLGVYALGVFLPAVQYASFGATYFAETVADGLSKIEISDLVIWAWYSGFLVSAIAELIGLFLAARWIVQPYKKELCASLPTDGTRFPVGAVLLLISVMLPFFFPVLLDGFHYSNNSIYQDGLSWTNVFDFTVQSFFWNLMVFPAVTLAVFMILKKRKIFLTASLGALALGTFFFPLLGWLSAFIVGEMKETDAPGYAELVLLLLAGGAMTLTILFLGLVSAGEIGKSGKNVLSRFKRLFSILAIASLAVFALIFAVPMLIEVIDLLIDFIKTAFDYLEEYSFLKALKRIFVTATYVPFELWNMASTLSQVVVDIAAWAFIALWVISPVKKSKKAELSFAEAEVELTEDAAFELAEEEAFEAAPVPAPAPSAEPSHAVGAEYLCPHCNNSFALGATMDEAYCPFCGKRVALR